MKLLIDIDDNDYEVLNKTGIEVDWNTAWHGKEKDREITFAIFDLVKALKNGIPVYEHERLKGEWLTHRVAFYLTCPFCGCNLRALKNEVFEGNYDYNFCPNCGADMRGEENGCDV